MKGLWENIVKYVGFIGSIVGIAWFAIANPEIVNQQFYDAINRLLPFLMLCFGLMAGWSLRDGMKKRDAETEARIKREDDEHAERMRRDREEYESARAEQAEKAERDKRLGAAATEFKSFDFDAKTAVCIAYDESEFMFDYDLSTGRDDFSSQVTRLTERETLPEGKYRYTLKPRAREMFDQRPDLLVDARAHLLRKRAAIDKQATRGNPELMLPYMSTAELYTLQKVVDNGGRLDPGDGFEGATYGTLVEFGMLEEYYDDPTGPPVFDLDQDVLAFFQKVENGGVIASYIERRDRADE